MERAFTLNQQQISNEEYDRNTSWYQKIIDYFNGKPNSSSSSSSSSLSSLRTATKKSDASLSSLRTRRRERKHSELEALNMYMIVFRYGVITFHFKTTPHPANVRRRARLLRDYLNVTADWIAYALIDDITDAYAPLIDSIEQEVNAIEDSILKMQSGSTSDDSDSDTDSDDSDYEDDDGRKRHHEKGEQVWFKMKRRNSTVMGDNTRMRAIRAANGDKTSLRSVSTRSSLRSHSTSSSSSKTKILSWKRKGDMLRRIGDCRRRVMSLLRLLGFKADVIKGFSKRCNEQWEVAPRSEIGMYLGDIQDHIVTMVSSLNHYEKLLARSHSNYLAQINIDMTKVNNDMNDILGKITILGTIVLPLNVVTGLWGMNCLVPGQDGDDLTWFWGIVACMTIFSFLSYYLAKKVSGIV
ncbi:unnamed protein product [Ambrosiozyma monospora]|uniref:Unnamed protein product n=1 Tax=Ambrosiozyma monospora TaxID=43982 RepID=A0ACB5SWL9_AMBMO|nr:unnamed protein product [Ambrosiozyma monospora]